MNNKQKWYHPTTVHTGWDKDMPMKVRRHLMLKAHKGDELASARALQALANVTTDKETRTKAESDAGYFYRQHRIQMRKSIRLTPRFRRLPR